MRIMITDILGTQICFENAEVDLMYSNGILVVRSLDKKKMTTFILRNVIRYYTELDDHSSEKGGVKKGGEKI